MSLNSEHIVFSELIDCVKKAENNCKALAMLRSDERWLQIAARFSLLKEQLYNAVGDGAVKS